MNTILPSTLLGSPTLFHPRGMPPVYRAATTARTFLVVLLIAGAVAKVQPLARAQEIATVTTLYSFNYNDGDGPQSGVVEGTDGNFYGTTYGGGPNDYGTVFQLTPAGVLTTLHFFTNGIDGSFPEGGLVEGKDGNFYGTTSDGGTNSDGTVFKITPAGVLTTLHSFVGSDGSAPYAGLVQGSDGNFYGTTYRGGSDNDGTVFRIASTGSFASLHSFDDVDDGNTPEAGLVEDTDGDFYGTTSDGGPGKYGTVFKITSSGAMTILHSFSYSDGGKSMATLTLDTDGSFYGTTVLGGSSDGGTVFKITPKGTFTSLYSFNGSGGTTPFNLALGSDGNLYGTTDLGGTSDNGTVFQITPAGALTTLHSFTYDEGNGAAGLVLGSDGSFYGAASGGGVNSSGTIFKLTVGVGSTHAAFFTGETALADGVYYLSFSNGNYFGYYSYLNDPSYIYHFDLGYEYVFDAADGKDGAYFYDFKSSDFFYTSPSFPFPYLYDFGLNSVVYYYPDLNNAGHYNTDGVRYFYVVNTRQIISK